MRQQWNFRDVLNREGIPLSNETDWTAGQIIAKLARDRGIEPERVLTEKTDPDPSVHAPHCIAHYPMSLFEPARIRIRDWWGERQKQMGLDL